MNTATAILEDESQYLRDSSLSAPYWFTPPASTSQDELDESHRAWRTQQGTEISSAPKLLIKISGPSPFWLSDVIENLNAILALKDNWNSYGACRIQLSAALASIRILLSVMKERTPLPAIVPIPSGGIQLEWHRSEIDLEVEISSSGHYSIFYEDATGETEPGESDLSYDPALTGQPLSTFIEQLTQRAITEE